MGIVYGSLQTSKLELYKYNVRLATTRRCLQFPVVSFFSGCCEFGCQCQCNRQPIERFQISHYVSNGTLNSAHSLNHSHQSRPGGPDKQKS